jgi:tRNA(fMet)-specific endonuclease VapC
MFLFDSDHISIWQRGQGQEYTCLIGRMRQRLEADFYWSIVSFHEQVIGWHAYIQQAKLQAGVVRGYAMYARLLEDFNEQQVLPYDQQAADIFDPLSKSGLRVAAMDLRIAAVALAHDFTLLTRSAVDFGRVPGLRIEDWTRS